MKINLRIEADSNVSLYCGGWLVSDDKDSRPLQVKLGNSAIAGLVSGIMPCHVEIPGKAALRGNIRKSENNEFFIVDKVQS